MEKVNEVFFGSKGLTSTSANHLANIARETVSTLMGELNSLSFVNEYVSILGSESEQTKKGADNSFLETMKEKLIKVSKLNAFIAWVSEAIKAKEDEINRLRALYPNQYFADLGIQFPEYYNPKTVTEKDIIANWTVKERNEYYMLEAEASTIGKYIHKDSPFAKARAEVNRVVGNPITVAEQSNYVVVHKYSISVDRENIESSFFDLQKYYRELTARLNKLKYRIKEEVNKANLENLKESEQINLEVKNKTSELTNQFREYQTKKIEEVSDLKIIIPEDLLPIFNELNNK